MRASTVAGSWIAIAVAAISFALVYFSDKNFNYASLWLGMALGLGLSAAIDLAFNYWRLR